MEWAIVIAGLIFSLVWLWDKNQSRELRELEKRFDEHYIEYARGVYKELKAKENKETRCLPDGAKEE